MKSEKCIKSCEIWIESIRVVSMKSPILNAEASLYHYHSTWWLSLGSLHYWATYKCPRYVSWKFQMRKQRWRWKVWYLYFLGRYKHESQPEGSHLYNIPPTTTSAQNMGFLELINQYPNKIWGLGNWYIHFPAKYLCFQLDAKQVWLVLNEYFHQQVLWIDQPISS